MANISRTVDIIFNGTDNISGSVGKISRSINTVVSAIEGVADPVAEVVDRLLQLEAAMLAVSSAIATVALASFKNYQFALIDLEKVLSDGEEISESFKAELEDVAIKYGQSIVDIVKSTTDFKRAGFSLEESFQLLNRALELSSAGMVDMETSTNNIIAVMKGFELEVEDATKVVDIINVVSDRYATNATELSDALRRVAPAAKLAGLSISETAAILTPAIEVFRSGEEASTAWRRGLIKILDDSKPVKEALKRLGVEQKDANGELRSGKDILFDLAKSLETATSSQQLFSLGQIFGSRQVAKTITALRDLDYVMEIESVAAGVTHDNTMKQVEKRWKSFEVQLGASKNAILIAAASLGEQLEPAAAKVLHAVTELFSSFRDNLREGAFDTLFDLLEGFGGDLSEYLLNVGQELPKALQDIDYSSLLKAFRGLFDEITEIVERFDLDTPEGLRDFLQEVADTAAGVINVTTGLIQKFDEFGTKILSIIRSFKDLGAEEQKSIGRISAGLKIIDTFGVKGAVVINELERSALNLSDVMVRISGSIQAAAGAAELGALLLSEQLVLLIKTGEATTQLIKGDFSGAWDTMASHAASALKRVESGTSNLGNGLSKLSEGADTVGESMVKASKKGSREFENMRLGIVESLNAQTDEFADFVEFVPEGYGAITDAATETANAIDGIFKEGMEESKSYFAGLADEFIEELDMRDEISEAIGWFHDEFDKLSLEIEKGAPRPFYVDEKRKADWEEYKKSLAGVAKETTSRVQQEELFLEEWQDSRDKRRLDSVKSTGEKITGFYGKFTDESLKVFKGIVPGLEEYDKKMSDAISPDDKELDVPDDAKFKAAQDKLLKEIDTNAGIIETKIKSIADIADSNAETISTAFESVSESVSSTGDVITDLYSQMASGRLDFAAQAGIQRQIRSEEERRQEAFDLQQQLTTAQIDLIKQRASAMAAGDPLITISGDGLQPHLEAFMWEILAAIQARVNEDYGSFLLGIGAT